MPTPGFSETSALVAVLEQKSFSKAAEQLGLSPARVSELVRNLEERLGVRLVERTTRSVAATAAGDRLLERLRPLLDDYQAALELAERFSLQAGGHSPPHSSAAGCRLRPCPRACSLYLAISRDQARCFDRPSVRRHCRGAFRCGNKTWRAYRARHDCRAYQRRYAIRRGGVTHVSGAAWHTQKLRSS